MKFILAICEINNFIFALQNPIILDANADKIKVKNLLQKLGTTLNDLQKQAFTFKSYQKNFKVLSINEELSFSFSFLLLEKT